MFPFFLAVSEGLMFAGINLTRPIAWLSGNISTLLAIIFISLTTVLFAKVADRLMQSYFKKISDRLHMDVTAFRMFRHITIGIIYFLGLVAIISQIPDLEKLSVALFTGAGVAGIVIGFAAQSTLSNIIAGLSLAVFQPFRVGDRVTIRSEYGKITDLNLRHTVITTWDNRRLIIPNSVISEEAVINWTIEDPAIIWPLDIGISYDADIDLARKIMIEEAKKHPDVMHPGKEEYSVMKPIFPGSELLRSKFLDFHTSLRIMSPTQEDRGEIEVLLTELGDFAVNLRLLIWFRDRSLAYGAGCQIRENIKKRFDQEGIEIPFPYRTIVYKKDIDEQAGSEKEPGEKETIQNLRT